MSTSDAIIVDENTTFVTDIDCGDTTPPDQGLDLCQFKDKDLPADNKPVSLTLTYSFGTTFEQVEDQESDKRDLDTFGSDTDGEVFIRVLDKEGEVIFEGTISEGESFSVAGNDKEGKFSSETHVEIYDFEGGELLQDIEFHTSCSQPLAIGDTFGSIAVDGATLGGGATFGLDATDGAPGDEGVVYTITGGDDADLFTVDAATGEINFIEAPDYENPRDVDGDNNYDVVVRATRTDGSFEDKPLIVCVEDDCINVEENTTYVTDLDCGNPAPQDLGLDLCQFKDKDMPADNKPVSLTLTYSFGTTFEQVEDQESDKRDIDTFGNDDDGEVFIRVLDKSGDPIFEGTVSEGESFSVAGNDKEGKFSSETHVEIYDFEGGELLQDIEFHTSCSQPLAIGDTFGSIAVDGATLGGGATFGLDATDGAPGDEGVIYAIIGGDDADLFTVDAATGEVNFIEAPDYENPRDVDGDNNYDVVVRATRADGTFEDKPLEICIDDDPSDDPICIDENTVQVIDLDLTVDCPVTIPGGDDGQDLCVFKDKDLPADNKPVQLTLTYSFGTTFEQVEDQESDKRDLDTFGSDTDGEVFIRVLDKDGDSIFEGSVSEGESFTVEGNDKEGKFSSETHVEIYDFEGGALLQDIEFHTSCSQPLAINDVFGSIAVTGAVLGGGMVLGGTTTMIETLGEGDIVYSIIGGADASLFQVDPGTGEVSFINAPDFENPLDDGGDNTYDVIVRATAVRDADCYTDRPMQIEVKDAPELGSLSGRYFCDDDLDGLDNDGPDNGIVGVTVELLNADGAPTGASTTTNADGNYQFTDLEPGTYGVKFTDTVSGKELTTPNVNGNSNDDIDSDALDVGSNMSEINGIEVVAGQNTPDNDAGVVPQVFELEKDFVYTDEDTPLDFNVLDNDTPSAGAVLSVIAAGQGEIDFQFEVPFLFTNENDRTGELTISEDGSVSFDPLDGFESLGAGEQDLVLFTYFAEDTNGNADGADVVIFVEGVDDPFV